MQNVILYGIYFLRKNRPKNLHLFQHCQLVRIRGQHLLDPLRILLIGGLLPTVAGTGTGTRPSAATRATT